MPRRAHRKSRNGCIECKRRHVKCDERRPKCVNCTISERHCEYPSETTPAPAASFQSESSRPTPSSASPAMGSPDIVMAAPQVEEQLSANMLHFELLYHLSTQTIPSLEMDDASIGVSGTDLLGICVSSPYLMNEALAFAALHLAAVSPPEKQGFYRNQAGHLQTQALSIFNTMNPEVNEDNCAAMFLFSAMLGNHLLCDALIFRDNDFDLFLDKLCRSIQLYRGVRTVAGLSIHMIAQTSLRPFIQFDYGSTQAPGSEYQGLMDLIRSARLGQPITDIYKEALENLQLTFDTSKPYSESPRTKASVTAWPVRVPNEYMDALKARRPEALIILAHYAVLLHDNRDSWVFCDSGRFLIESINGFVGTGWEEWMAFPNNVLDGTVSPYLST